MSSPRCRVVCLVLVVVAASALAILVGLPSPAQVHRFAADHRGWSWVIGVLGVASATALMLPRSAVAVLAGVVFGPWPGIAYAMVGALVGASVAFAAGRLLGQGFVEQVARGRLRRWDGWLARSGFSAVVWARLVPAVPFGLSNYLFGVSRVRSASFVLGTVVGILPTTVVYTWAGASAQALTSPTLLLTITSVAAVAVLTVLMFRVRRAHTVAPRQTPDTGRCPDA